MKKLPLLVLLNLSMIGCAAAPLPDAYYDQLAQQIVGAQKCGVRGFIPAETAAMAMRFSRNKLNEYAFNKPRMEERLKFSDDVLMVTREECNAVAVWAMGVNGNSVAAPVQYVPRTTNCSTYFGQTHCTSF